jgi:hypothetical protein
MNCCLSSSINQRIYVLALRVQVQPQMRRVWALVVLVICSSHVGLAQTLSGQVIGPQQQVIEFATVRLYQPRGITPQYAVSANEHGAFIIENAKPGSYVLVASAVGWRTDSLRLTLPTAPVIIQLQSSKNILQEVLVQGSKPLIEKRADRLIYNVGNSLLAESSSLWEMLGKAPLVKADEQAGLTMRNTPGVAVYVNDRRIYLSGDALTQYLQSIRAADVARIEVMTTPPARYDAEGDSGVINIVLKSSPAVGLNGSAQATYIQTQFAKFNSTLNLNYRNDKLNIYGSGTLADGEYYRRENYSQQYLHTNYEEVLRVRSNRKTQSTRLGIDFFATKRQTIGILLQANWAASASHNDNQGLFQRETTLDSTIRNTVNQQISSRNYNLNANYQFALDSTGRVLTADADVVRFDAPQNIALNNNDTFDSAGNLLRQISFHNGVVRRIDIKAFKLDYEQPWRGGSLSVGAKIVNTENNNKFLFDNILNSEALSDSLPSSTFTYTERIGALYAIYKRKSGKWDWQTGLRGEWTDAQGTAQSRVLLERNYFRLFPTVFVQYNQSDAIQFSFNYSRRTTRPNFDALNPFRNYINPYSYYVGNPLLQPAFTHALEVAMSYKDTYNFSIFYRYTEGRQTQVPIQDQATNSYRMVYVNVDNSGSYGAYTSFSQRITPYWETSTTLTAMLVFSRTNFLGSEFRERGFYGNIASSNSFLLSADKTLRGELALLYSPPGNIQGLFRLGGQTMVDVTLTKQLLNSRLNISLTGTDLFNQAYVSARVAYRDQQNITTGFLDRRGVRLSLLYKFGKASVKGSRQRNTSATPEGNRI